MPEFELVFGPSNLRLIVTVRTPIGGSYTIETTDETVKVGDTWPK